MTVFMLNLNRETRRIVSGCEDHEETNVGFTESKAN